MSISKEDHERIAIAIHSAEAKTSGEIVCVLAQTSTHTTALPVFISAVTALAMPWLLVTFTAMTVHRILSLQVVAFLVLLTLLCLPRVRVALCRLRRAAPSLIALPWSSSKAVALAEEKIAPGF
jgi:putative membrane protein